MASKSDGRLASYVYCLVGADAAPSLADVPEGPPAVGAPRLVEAGAGRWLVVADAPLERYDEVAIAAGLKDLDWVSDCALRHEAVNEALMDKAAALLPMKLFTLFHDDNSARRHIESRAGDIAAVMERIAGCVEYGLRATVVASARAEERTRPSSGAAFLQMKKQRRDAAKNAVADGREAAAEALAGLTPFARAHKQKPLPEGTTRVVLDAVLLVPSPERAQLESRARQLAGELDRRGVALTLTGPWPAHHFLEPS